MIKGINVNSAPQPAAQLPLSIKSSDVGEVKPFSIQSASLSPQTQKITTLDLSELIATLKQLLAPASLKEGSNDPVAENLVEATALGETDVNGSPIDPNLAISVELQPQLNTPQLNTPQPITQLNTQPAALPTPMITLTDSSIQHSDFDKYYSLEQRQIIMEQMKGITLDSIRGATVSKSSDHSIAASLLTDILPNKIPGLEKGPSNNIAPPIALTPKPANTATLDISLPITSANLKALNVTPVTGALSNTELANLLKRATQPKTFKTDSPVESKALVQSLPKDTNILVSRATQFSSSTLINEVVGDTRAQAVNEPNSGVTTVTRSSELNPLSLAKERAFGGEEMKSLAQRIATISEHQSRGEIKQLQVELTPKDLGKIDIKLAMNVDKLNISVNVANSNVRDWLNYGADRLRLFIEQEANVSVDVDIQGQAKQHKERDQDPALSLLSQLGTQEQDGDTSMTSTQTTAIAKA